LPILRLCILTYSLWSFVEWGFHNWIMHAKPKSWGRKFLRGHNLLHLDHHKDTDRHMILKVKCVPHSRSNIGAIWENKTTHRKAS
jgi:hypothetical protein